MARDGGWTIEKEPCPLSRGTVAVNSLVADIEISLCLSHPHFDITPAVVTRSTNLVATQISCALSPHSLNGVYHIKAADFRTVTGSRARSLLRTTPVSIEVA